MFDLKNLDPSYSWKEETAPTHKCKVCGAMWRFYRKEETGADTDSWNLQSDECGTCCDQVTMGEQIVPVSFHDVERVIKERHAKDLYMKLNNQPSPFWTEP